MKQEDAGTPALDEISHAGHGQADGEPTTRPVSENWFAGMLRGLGVTLEQLRVDRHLSQVGG